MPPLRPFPPLGLRSAALGVLLVGALDVGCATSLSPESTVILVRHAEKRLDQGQDPELTAEGAARSEALLRILRDVPLKAVFSSQYKRTRATVAPIAKEKGLEVQLIDAKAPRQQAAAALAARGPVLIAGHSNTLGPLVEALGGEPIAPITDNEYDGLYFVVVNGPSVRVHLLRYGAASPKR